MSRTYRKVVPSRFARSHRHFTSLDVALLRNPPPPHTERRTVRRKIAYKKTVTYSVYDTDNRTEVKKGTPGAVYREDYGWVNGEWDIVNKGWFLVDPPREVERVRYEYDPNPAYDEDADDLWRDYLYIHRHVVRQGASNRHPSSVRNQKRIDTRRARNAQKVILARELRDFFVEL